MAKIRPYVFFLLILVAGLVVGFFKFQNTARVEIDLIFSDHRIDPSLGDALVGAWVIGFAFGALLVSVHVLLQKMENRHLSRRVRTLEKQVEKMAETSRKEAGK